jgi:hypothetical protein
MQLPTWQRREVIEDLLDLQIFTGMNAVAKERQQDNEKNLELDLSQRRLDETALSGLLEQKKMLETNRERVVADLRRKLQEVLDEMRVAMAENVERARKIRDMEAEIADVSNMTKDMDTLLSIRHKLEANLSLLDKEVKFFENNVSCPTCKREIDFVFRGNALTERANKTIEIKEGLTALIEKYGEMKTAVDDNKKAREAVSALKVKSQLTQTRIDTMKKQAKYIADEIEKDSVHDDGVIDDRIDAIRDRVLQTSARLRQTESNREIMNAIVYVLRDEGIKSQIVSRYVPIINEAINKYLAEFELFADFTLDENFNETIRSRHRDNFSYESFSEGEKARLDLAILFAWREVARHRNSISTNLLIMDEVFDGSLDAEGSELLMKLINQVSDSTNVLVISHKVDALCDRFKRVVRFAKVKNFSVIGGRED